MARNNIRQFQSHLAAQGKDPLAYEPKSPDVSGVFKLRERDQLPTQPPPSGMASDLRRKANHIRKLAAALLAEANDLDRAAERCGS